MKVNPQHKTDPEIQAKIVAAVWRKGKSLRNLSISRGLSQNACSVALNSRVCVAGEIAICELLEISPFFLWPERWENPTPKRGAWVQANRKNLEKWAGNRLEDVGR